MPVILYGTCPVHGDFQTPPERSTCPTCLTQAALYRQIEMDGVEGIRPVHEFDPTGTEAHEPVCSHSDVRSVIDPDGSLFRCNICGAGARDYLNGKPNFTKPPLSTEAHELGACLDEAKRTICGERQDVYGSPEDSFAIIAEYWSTYLRAEYEKVGHRNLTPKDIAHMMILFKMARVQGQAPSRDSYVDICGYAGIAADRLSK